jgi:hypothetical protein
MFCQNCGIKLSNNDGKFCSNCGTELKSIAKSEELSGVTKSTLTAQQVEHLIPNGSKRRDQTIAEAVLSSNNPVSHSTTQNSANDNVYWWSRFYDKWGIGWILFVVIYFNPTMTKNTSEYLVASRVRLFEFCCVVISLSVYFIMRQLVLKKIEKRWLRSLISGIIAYIATSVAYALLLPAFF